MLLTHDGTLRQDIILQRNRLLISQTTYTEKEVGNEKDTIRQTLKKTKNMANINENEKSSLSQNAKIAEYLKQGNSITPLDALKMFGCLRLGARIADLKERGLNIVTERVVTPNGKRVASYKLVD